MKVMDCNDARQRLSAGLDGELDVAEQIALDEHLAACAGCRSEMDGLRLLSRSVAIVGAKRAPLALRQRLRSELGKETRQRGGRPSLRALLDMRTLGIAASVALAILLSAFGGYQLGSRGGGTNVVQRDAVAAHIRSLLQETQIQVASSDSHTVKPWFAGRVDASPAVRDLVSDGFALLGGRLDYVGSRRVGALVYKQRQHIVTVYFWPSSDADARADAVRQNGYNVLQWTTSGITYLAVSDLNVGDLQRLSQLL
jgi:anti-sigma factor RsiW